MQCGEACARKGKKEKGVVSVDTSGIEPDTFRSALKVRSERDKPTTPCAPCSLGHPKQSGPCQAGEFKLGLNEMRGTVLYSRAGVSMRPSSPVPSVRRVRRAEAP
jgi:hypothetical protein